MVQVYFLSDYQPTYSGASINVDSHEGQAQVSVVPWTTVVDDSVQV